MRLAAVAVVAALVAACGPVTPPAPAGATEAWLHRYVQPDGRVSRLDQGGDTVSEGQSYALALALATHDDSTFGRVWAWTRDHLQRPDGLFAYHATPNGQVLDRTPATDADLVIAWALLRHRDHDGPRVAAAVRRLETVTVGAHRVLAAGPWATGHPATLNPSYWAFPVLRELDRLQPGAGWGGLADGASALLAGLPDVLPPDWTRADGAVVRAEPLPDGAHPMQYGLDAQRVLAWSAWSCVSTDRAAARRAASATTDPVLASDLSGRPLQRDASALALVAAAAAEQAAGRPAPAGDQARSTAARFPTYYGDAWVGLEAVHAKLFDC